MLGGKKTEENRAVNEAGNGAASISLESCLVSKNDAGVDGQSGLFIENSVWLNTKDAAVYLRRFRKDGVPSDAAIRTAIWRKQLNAKKFLGRLYIRRTDLERMLQNSPDWSNRWA